MSRSSTGQQVKPGYTDKDLENTLNKLWDNTVRLRTQSENTWSKKMAKLVTKAASTSLVPVTTLRRHFIRRMEKEASTLSRAERALQRSKKKADARGLLTGWSGVVP